MDGGPIYSQPGVVAVPSDRAWLDPRLISLLFETRATFITLAAGVLTRVAPGDPRRVAVGFSGLATYNLAPWPDVGANIWHSFAASAPVWYNLHTHYNLVQVEWYANAGAGANIAVIEIIRK